MPELRRLLIADDPEAWAGAGFTVEGDRTVLGSVAVRFVPRSVGTGGPDGADGSGGRGPGWELAGLTGPPLTGLDGIATAAVVEPIPEPVTHPNGVVRLDHVVIRTPDLGRTIGALEAAGFEVRRSRDVPGSSPTVRQVFLWAGEAILEVVGPADAGGQPDRSPDRRTAAIWGLALTTADLDRAAELLGTRLSAPRAAVQPGRRIATIDTAALGIGPALALMSPHVGGGTTAPAATSLDR